MRYIPPGKTFGVKFSKKKGVQDMSSILKEGREYFVTHRDLLTDRVSRKTRRVYFGREKRFGEIDCLVFSSRVQKGKDIKRELSIPHYCIDCIEEIAEV